MKLVSLNYGEAVMGGLKYRVIQGYHLYVLLSAILVSYLMLQKGGEMSQLTSEPCL